MRKKNQNINFPTRTTFFIEPKGMVTIAALFAEVLPIALSLNPEDKRIEKFVYQIKRKECKREV
jgi:hypothetical protein